MNKVTDIRSTRIPSQQTRLLTRLRKGPVNTFELLQMNIMQPAARVCELNDKGYDIKAHYQDMEDPDGYMHRGIAIYYLPTETTHIDPEDAA